MKDLFAKNYNSDLSKLIAEAKKNQGYYKNMEFKDISGDDIGKKITIEKIKRVTH